MKLQSIDVIRFLEYIIYIYMYKGGIIYIFYL